MAAVLPRHPPGALWWNNSAGLAAPGSPVLSTVRGASSDRSVYTGERGEWVSLSLNGGRGSPADTDERESNYDGQI